MKNNKNLLTVIITTYNRYNLLKRALSKVYKQTYKNLQVIVSDDCSTDNTENIKKDFPEIEYIKTQENLGYTKNSRFALQYAKGKFITFLSDDDCLVDNTFFEKVIETFNKDSRIDSVFGRTAIKDRKSYMLNKYPFKNIYNSQKFIQEIIKLRFIFLDYFSFSSFIFKSEYLKKIKPFETIFQETGSIDISTIIKYLFTTRKVGFVDIIAYQWTKNNENSLSGKKKNDLVYQTLHTATAAIDIYNFFSDKSKCINICNEYIIYAFNAILSDYEQLKNKENFEKILKKVKNKKNIYIYGRGWTGLELKKFLEENGIDVKYFIDDYKTGYEDTIDFQTLKNFSEEKTVIISSYKYKDIYFIYKKLNKLESIEIFDLVS